MRSEFCRYRVCTLTVKSEPLCAYSRIFEISVECQPLFEVADYEPKLMEDDMVVERADHEPVPISCDLPSSVLTAGCLPDPAPETRRAGEEALRLHVR